MKETDGLRLDVYVESGCSSCDRAVKLAHEFDAAYERISVRILDMTEAPETADVFAVPTFVLNGQVVSLGNPDRSDLRHAIESLLTDVP